MNTRTISLANDDQEGLRQVIKEKEIPELGQTNSNSVQDILHAIRTHLKMDVGFIAEFIAGKRIFRYVDSGWAGNPVHVGNGDPLEQSYCQRVVDGRLPELIHDARENAVAAELAATFDIPVGAHMSIPILLTDGSVYGTFCCFSHYADLTLNMRDLSLMRVFAELAGKMIDRERVQNLSHTHNRQRIQQILTENSLSMIYQPIFDLHSGRVTGFEWEDAVKGLEVWAYVDAALNADKRNGRSSTGFVVMVGNTPVVAKARTQSSVEKSTYGSEFVACQEVIEEVLGVRELLRSMDYKVTKPSRVFCDNRSIVVAACGTNMMIKKRSTALAFHMTREAIAAGAVELQHIAGEYNWSDFLTKAVDNCKFMSCTKGLMVPCVKAKNL